MPMATPSPSAALALTGLGRRWMDVATVVASPDVPVALPG